MRREMGRGFGQNGEKRRRMAGAGTRTAVPTPKRDAPSSGASLLLRTVSALQAVLDGEHCAVHGVGGGLHRLSGGGAPAGPGVQDHIRRRACGRAQEHSLQKTGMIHRYASSRPRAVCPVRKKIPAVT